MDATRADVAGPARPASATDTTEPEGAGAQRPASTARVLLVMTGIAVVTMALVVLAPRVLTPGDDDDRGGEVPTSLAGGQPFTPVPPEVEAVVEGPVLGTQRTNVLPDGLEPTECVSMAFGFSDGNVGILGGYTTPDGTWLAVRPAQGPPDDGPKPMGEEAAICLAAQNDAGTWGLQPEVSTSVGPASSSWSCCTNGRGFAVAGRQIPQGATWALLDLGSHHLAFDVSGMTWAPLAWTYPNRFLSDGPDSAEVKWVSAGGELLAAESL